MPSPPPQFPVSEWLASNELAFAVRAPSSRGPGHTIVVPRRPLASYFLASSEEKAALWARVDEIKSALDETLHPDGYEVGFTTGEVAGCVAPFAHIDVIPRFRQSAADPLDVNRQRRAARTTDGARTARAAPLTTGGEDDPLSRHLAPLFASATEIAIVAAFVTETGLALLERWVFAALRAGASLRIVTGDYLAFNQVDALRQLLGWSQLEVHARGEPLDVSPRGKLRVRVVETALADGTERAFHPKSCNVARPVATDRNRLADLMRSWFGPNAGHPGTRFQVQLSRSPDGWWIEPVGKQPALPARGRLVAYPNLHAAAGVAAGTGGDAPEPEHVILPVEDTDDLFAVRATGNSMNGGKTPIADGDWLVMRWARGAGVGSLAGRVALVQTPDGHDTFAYQVKRIVQDGSRWWLRSDNSEQADIEATADTTPIARLVASFAPESLAPAVGERLTPDSLGAAFKLPPETTIQRTRRYKGHLFVLVTQPDRFAEPDRLSIVIDDRRPGETAFVLARLTTKDRWRYCGVARWQETEGLWTIPALDFATWRALGMRRGCSQRLPADATARAHSFLDELFRRAGPGGYIEHDGKCCRIVERTAGGIRIDGGDDGFAERRVSTTDVAWVIVAADDVARHGGVLDEARVNRFRYLAGTPKGSTRWIDTGWAIVMFAGSLVIRTG